jgi:hypothetical protein
LFSVDEPSEAEAVGACYRRLRKLGITLHLEYQEDIITASRLTLGVPSRWAPIARRYF